MATSLKCLLRIYEPSSQGSWDFHSRYLEFTSSSWTSPSDFFFQSWICVASFIVRILLEVEWSLPDSLSKCQKDLMVKTCLTFFVTINVVVITQKWLLRDQQKKLNDLSSLVGFLYWLLGIYPSAMSWWCHQRENEFPILWPVSIILFQSWELTNKCYCRCFKQVSPSKILSYKPGLFPLIGVLTSCYVAGHGVWIGWNSPITHQMLQW